ncbi:MAG: class I SAM-dependent methyltransferase [Streptosporangiaceae bacterium]
MTHMENHEHWQLDGGAPEIYQRHLVPAVTAIWAADLVERVGLRRGARVLDVACGTGVVARMAAERVGRTGRVAGLDINQGMLAVARSVQGVGGSTIGWHQGSVLALPFLGASYDVVMCQLGLQFFPDRPAALAEMRRVLVTGGKAGLSVFGPIEHNPATFALAQALDRHLGPGASAVKRAEHLLADTTTLRALADEAGFRRITVATETRLVRFPSAADYVRIQLTATPLASQLTTGAGRPRQQVTELIIDEVTAALRSYHVAGALAFPQETHVLAAEA